jgi:hypothetical protein
MSNAAMESTAVAITAEWAYWGKTASDRGYRLLDCSEGNFGPDNFIEVLTRYSPGTLDRLPQVTVSWSRSRSERTYVAIAIHDRAEHGLYDADGREIVFTRYFCVPYEDLAAGTISYLAMYGEFSKFALPVPDRAPIQTALATHPPGGPGRGQALRVAALLLTGQPVCIVGADRVDLLERLQFLDAVVSLLPYGMRCRLSASTWASSTLQTHKFRLFFAGAPRPARDRQQVDLVVEWGQPAATPIGHPYADDYLEWLQGEVQQPAVRLAAQKQQIDFTQSEILKMLETVGIPADGLAFLPYTYDVDPSGAPQRSTTGPMRIASTEQLIISFAQHLSDANRAFLQADMKALRDRLGHQPTIEERANYQKLIEKQRLLREDLPVNASLRAEIYDVLLGTAFSASLTYASYKEIEACVGNPEGQSLHKSLLESMARLTFGESVAYLLVMGTLMDKGLIKRLQKDRVDHKFLIDATATRELLPKHARVLCDTTVQFLRERSGHIEQQDLRWVLKQHGYLAEILNGHHGNDQEYQLHVLTQFVMAAYGVRLDRSAAAEILGSTRCAPTSALLATVLRMINPEDLGLVTLEYARGVLLKTPFTDDTRRQLMRFLSTPDQPGCAPDYSSLAQGGDPPPGMRSWFISHLPSRG